MNVCKDIPTLNGHKIYGNEDRQEKAMALITSISMSLDMGVMHYRKSDLKYLTTVREVIEALKEEREVIMVPPVEEPNGS